jgi:hypothetical protein
MRIVEKVIEELLAGGYLTYLERLGVIRVIRFDAITMPSGVAAPARVGYALNPSAMLLFSGVIVLLFVLHRLQGKK